MRDRVTEYRRDRDKGMYSTVQYSISTVQYSTCTVQVLYVQYMFCTVCTRVTTPHLLADFLSPPSQCHACLRHSGNGKDCTVGKLRRDRSTARTVVDSLASLISVFCPPLECESTGTRRARYSTVQHRCNPTVANVRLL